MKILFSLTYYTPYSSGLTLYVKRLGESLVKKGHGVTVLTMNFDKRQLKREFVKDVEVVRADYLAKISKGFFSFDWLIKSWQEVIKADTVIITLPQFEGFIPAIWAKLLRKRIVVIYLSEVKLPSNFLNIIAEKALYLANFASLLLANKVITYNQDFSLHSNILPVFINKLLYVNPPIMMPIINNRAKKLLIEKIDHFSGYKIGVVARIAAEKGIQYLLEVVPLLRQRLTNNKFRIFFVGPQNPVGEEDYRKKILNLVEKYKEYVVFLGQLKDEEMGAFYSLCDVLVLPSINSTEAFGMVQVEAMMMGVPVVATDLPGVRIPIRETGMGLIVPIKNSQKLAEAIVEVLLNRNKYIKEADLIKREFSIEKTISFYQKLL